MKKINRLIYFLLTLFIVLMQTGCDEEFLEEDLQSSYGPENVLKDSLGFEAAMAGLQRLVREKYNGPQGMIATMQVGTDVYINGGRNVEGSQIPYEEYSLMNSQDAAAANFWAWGYRVINSANLIIEGAKSENAELSDYGSNYYQAEAMFFRAHAYNFLSIVFGEVPLVTEPIKKPKTDFVRAPMTEILNTMITDLTFAAEHLPDITDVPQTGRINKWAAKHLLAEVYIRANQPALAEKECDDILKSTRFQLTTERYGVKKDAAGDPYSDMFVYGNQRYQQGNKEAIWVIEQIKNVPGGTDGQSQWRRVWVPQYWAVSGMVICDSLGGRGLGRMRSNHWWSTIYEAGDMRNSKYNLRREFYYNDPALLNGPDSAKFGKLVEGVTGEDTLNKIFPHPTKWYEFDPTDVFGWETQKDRIVMRLSETYLLMAEAQLMQDDPDGAAASINAVRGRANATPVDPSEVTLDYILDERARELIGEEERRVTLVRTGKLVERVRKYNPVSAAEIQDHNMLLPIPQAQIELNKDAELRQNDEY